MKTKKVLSFVLSFLPLMLMAQERIMVIADPHVMPQTLIAANPNFDEYMEHQRKMLDLSEPIWNALMDTALKYRPQLVLIPGDLTKDGEPEAHALVAESLRQLNDSGIQTLVIPGNHDLPNTVFWDSLYMTEDMVKDPNSHSYAVEPFSGVTVIGLDATDGNASVGTLSTSSMNWLFAQADSANAKGNMIIMMCHWQILEHFDQQGTLESSCRMADADAFRDSLMAHGVHLVLTGHFHVNGITTYLDSINSNDSLVEITTGSPITFPCPYRWMTVSQDRANVSVSTDFITSLDTIADMNAYSRAWMAVHTENMIPTLANKAWGKVDANWNTKVVPKLQQMGLGDLTIAYIKAKLPKNEAERVDITKRHLGEPAVNMYLFHSEANEHERPEMGQELANAVYNGMNGMMGECFSSFIELLGIFQIMAREMAKEPVQSLVENITCWHSPNYRNCTNDLTVSLNINEPMIPNAIEQNTIQTEVRKIIRDGQLVIIRDGHQYNVYGVEIAQ